MRYLFMIIALSCCLLSSMPAFSAEKIRVAIIDFQGKNISNVTADIVTDMIRSDFVDSGMFTVVERSQMETILKEQSLQMTGCTDDACAVKIGKLLSAKKMIVGEIGKLGKIFMITTRLVDVETGTAEFSAKQKAESEDTLDKAARQITIQLIARITGKKESELISGIEGKTMTGYYLRSIVPGWGQFYAGRNVKGYTFLGTFIAAGAFTAYSIYNFNAKRADYEDLRDASESEFKSKHDAADSALMMANISYGVLAAVYVANWIDVLFFSKPEADTFSLNNKTPDNSLFSFGMFNSSCSAYEQYYNMSFKISF